MLKIKDNIDLKELEKFGFVLEGKEYSYYADKNLCVLFITNARDIFSYLHDFLNTDYDILFDLIQAGLVEKVER